MQPRDSTLEPFVHCAPFLAFLRYFPISDRDLSRFIVPVMCIAFTLDERSQDVSLEDTTSNRSIFIPFVFCFFLRVIAINRDFPFSSVVSGIETRNWSNKLSVASIIGRLDPFRARSFPIYVCSELR